LGNSLKGLNLLLNKIQRQLGYQIGVKKCFLNPTISRCPDSPSFNSIPPAEYPGKLCFDLAAPIVGVLSQFKKGSNAAYNIQVLLG
jgi:hypothetical protein